MFQGELYYKFPLFSLVNKIITALLLKYVLVETSRKVMDWFKLRQTGKLSVRARSKS